MKKLTVCILVVTLSVLAPVLYSQTILNDFDGNFRSKGWVKSESGSYYFGNIMRLYGDDATALFFRSNHSNSSQMLFRDKEIKLS